MDAVFKNRQDKKLVCYFDVPKIAKTKNPTVLIVQDLKAIHTKIIKIGFLF
jgi:hypothetical protein